MCQNPRFLNWIHCTVVLCCFLELGYRTTQALPTYVVLANSRVELPCDLNVTSSEDEVSLVLWLRGESGIPVYSVDARDAPLQTAKHFPASDMQGRAHFDSIPAPAVLKIESIQKSEEGMYRCRVEYRRARTETTDMILKVVVPPKEAIIMDEYGQHLRGVIGPFNEGFPLSLACEGEGGDPLPAVTWWRGSDLLDDSFGVTPQGFARNELLLRNLKRLDLMRTLTCQVSNSNLSEPVSSSVIIDMNLRPTDVRITSLYRPLSVGRDSEVVCVSRGARPPAQISWWMLGEQLKSRVRESSTREDNLTVSTLTLSPKPEDNQKNLSCRADNPQLPDSLIEDSWFLNVQYRPRLIARVEPFSPVVEGSDVTLTCEITANPPITKLEWLLEGRPVEKQLIISEADKRQATENRTLSIPSVGPKHKGYYQCLASNDEGTSESEAVQLSVRYVPKCQSVRSSVYGVGKTESVSVSCEVDAEPSDLTFYWMLNNSAVSLPLPSSMYTTNGTRKSVATVSPRSPEDYGVLYCWANNSMGRQKEACSFRIVPAGPPQEPKNCVITNRTSRCVSLECREGEDGGLRQIFQLDVFGPGFDSLLANQTAHKSPYFTVCGLPPTENLAFVIYSTNSKGRSRQITLHTATLALEEKGEGDLNDSGRLNAILGVVVGAAAVSLILGVLVLVIIKHQGRNASEGGAYESELEKCSVHHLKECKEPGIPNSQGPDIIPEKRLFKDRTDLLAMGKVEDGGPSTVLSSSDPDVRQYYDYQTTVYTDTPEFLSKPPHLLQNVETENFTTAETPLISSIPLAAQQWTDHHNERLRLSTPV